MRTALLGGGTIARLILEHVKGGALSGVEVVGLSGRAAGSRGEALARKHGVPFVVGRDALLATRPQAVVEAASHEAVREHLVGMLEAGVSVIVLSAGALADDALRVAAEQHRRARCTQGRVRCRSRLRKHPHRQAAGGLEKHSVRGGDAP
jgi:aspartate dehydrogenase